jgi:hypothetical protein
MTPEQEDALFDLALRMAQDLREYADAAQEAGEHIQATDVLLEEFDELVRNLDQDAHEESYSKPLPDWAARAVAG